MKLDVVMIYVLGIAFLSWLWNIQRNIFLACWRPHRAKNKWLALVTFHERRFFTIFRWSSPILLFGFTLQILNAVLLLVVEVK